MNSDKSVLEHAEHELFLIGVKDTPVGEILLSFIKEISPHSKNDHNVMQIYAEMLKRIFSKKILSPITEKDFEEQDFNTGHEVVKIKRCTRNPYVFQWLDGKYYNERGIVYINPKDINHRMYIYDGKLHSKTEIYLPYDGEEKVVYIDDNENVINYEQYNKINQRSD